MSKVEKVISDEAVEAAAKSIARATIERESKLLHQFFPASDFKSDARAALEAAAPYIKAYPHSSGDCTVIGPECFTNESAEVICYKGVNYYRSHGDQ